MIFSPSWPPGEDRFPVSPHALQGLRRDVGSFLDLPVEEHDAPAGEKHIENPDLLAPEFEEPVAQDAGLRSPESVAPFLEDLDEGEGFVPVAPGESGHEDLDERLALFRSEDIDDPGAGRHLFLQSRRNDNS